MIYFDLAMGAAGDMLCAALYELLSTEQKADFIKAFDHLGIPDVRLIVEKTTRCSVAGTRFHVMVNGKEEADELHHTHNGHNHYDHDHNHHTTMSDIESIVARLCCSEHVKSDVVAVYRLIADAESRAHGVDVSLVHFHEVGAMDAVADIAAFALLMEMLGNPSAAASAVCVGSGVVQTAHGTLNVPAPAVVNLLQDIPFYTSPIGCELCTPTGAALMRYAVTSFDARTPLVHRAVGYGMGSRELNVCNAVRAFLCEEDAFSGALPAALTDEVCILSCEIDDMTGEEIGFACERLMEKGALDVHTTPVYMKKGRAGITLTVLCAPDNEPATAQNIFALTTTLGIRTALVHRHILHRETAVVSTPNGEVRVKTATGYSVSRHKCEALDVANIARTTDTSFMETERMAEAAVSKSLMAEKHK